MFFKFFFLLFSDLVSHLQGQSFNEIAPNFDKHFSVHIFVGFICFQRFILIWLQYGFNFDPSHHLVEYLIYTIFHHTPTQLPADYVKNCLHFFKFESVRMNLNLNSLIIHFDPFHIIASPRYWKPHSMPYNHLLFKFFLFFCPRLPPITFYLLYISSSSLPHSH